jgi:hypothetical protein
MNQVTRPFKYILFKATVHSAMGTTSRQSSGSQSLGWQCRAPLLTLREPASPEPGSQQQSLGFLSLPLSAAFIGAISLEFYLREMGILPHRFHLTPRRAQETGQEVNCRQKWTLSTSLPSTTRGPHTDLSRYNTLILFCRQNIHRLVLGVL